MFRFCLLALFLSLGSLPFQAFAQEATPSVADSSDVVDLEKEAAKLEIAGDVLGAIHVYDRAIALAPKNWFFYFRRAGLYVINKNFHAASSDYDEVLKIDPSQGSCISIKKAFLFSKNGQPKIAMNTLAKLLDSQEDDASKAAALVNLSILRLKNRGIQPDQYTYPIERDLDAAIRLDPKSKYAYYNRGVYRFYEENYQEASEDFSQALELDKEYTKASSNLSITQEKLKKLAMTSELTDKSKSDPLTKPRQLNLAKKSLQTFSLDIERTKPLDYEFDKRNQCDVDFSSYITALKARVRIFWKAPETNTSLKTIINFKITKNGSADNLSIRQSSGSEKVDQAALEAIQKASPFAPLPLLYPGKLVEVTFTFDINVYGK